MILDINTLIAWGAAYKKVAKGDVVFSEGDDCYFYYQLVSGGIRWQNIDEEGKEYIQTMIEPGECFGEMSLFDEEPYAASAIAADDSLLIRLRKETFLQLINENQNIHFLFTKMLAKGLRFKFLLLKSIAHPPELRITALLNYLKKENKNFCSKCNQLKLTRQQVADMTGLRVETVIRSMRHLHNRGELNIEKGKVYY